MKMSVRSKSTTLSLLLACVFLLASCSENGGFDTDGGMDGKDGGADDGGISLSWPAESLELEGVQPSIAISDYGTVVLAYVSQGQVWVMVNPLSGGGPAVSVGDGVGEMSWVRTAGSPSEDLVLVVWSYARGVWVDSSGPRLPSKGLVDSFDVGDRLDATWSSSRPLLVMDDKTGTKVLRLASEGLAPAPVADDVMIEPRTSAYYFNEVPYVAQIGNDRVLMFALQAERDDDGYGTKARWLIGQYNQDRGYYRVHNSGLIDIPGEQKNSFWLQLHDIGRDGLVLSLARTSPLSQVFDVFLVKIQMNQEGEPEFVGDILNLSDTPGQTDNSDHPLVLPTGDGRLWVAWRETNFGPRVALLDPDLELLAITAPDDELNLDNTQPISAMVDVQGALNLVAVVRPDGSAKIRYWRFVLP